MLPHPIDFRSDNVTGISPEILAAIAAANTGSAMPYGEDEYTQRLQTLFSEWFETSVTVFPVVTGSAANSLALSVMTPAYGAIYCHEASHIQVDECGAPEFYTGGAKLVTLPGTQGKISAADLAKTLDRAGTGVVHHVQPAAVSITQATEAGTVYKPDEISQLVDVARSHHLYFHVDGARFANAVASLGCSPADITWRAGVDVLCLGATKNGAMAAEAVIFFNQDLIKTFPYRRKRAGHLFSKMRFLSAQLEAYLSDDLWLKNATHANKMATRFVQEISEVKEAKLCYPVEANEIFLELPETTIERLFAEGFQFYRWESASKSIIRLVTAFNTQEFEIMALAEAIKHHLRSPENSLKSAQFQLSPLDDGVS